MKCSFLSRAILLFLSLCATQGAWAQTTDTWLGTAGTFTWSTQANWASGSAPNLTGDSLAFSGTYANTASQNDLGAASFANIVFNSGAGSVSITSKSGSTLAVTSTITDNSANVETFNTALTLGGNVTMTTGAGANLSFLGKVSGSKSVTLTGTGTVTMAGGGVANTYTGGTNVNGGTLLVTTTATAGGTGTGSVNVSNGATLGGSGVIAPTVANSKVTMAAGSILASGMAGSSASGLTLAGNGTTGFLTLASGAAGTALDFTLGAGNAASTLKLTASFANEVAGLSGNTFNFADLTAGSLSTGEYSLILADSSAAVFQGLGLGTLSGFTLTGLSGYTAQLELNTVGGNEALQLDILSAAPEPGTWALALSGLGLLAVLRRRAPKLS